MAAAAKEIMPNLRVDREGLKRSFENYLLDQMRVRLGSGLLLEQNSTSY